MKNKIYYAFAVLILSILPVFTQNIIPIAHASGACNISSFYASPSTVSYGGSTNLIINSYGCQNMTLSGGTYANSQIGTINSLYIGSLYTTTTYTITGYDYYNNPTYASTIVVVNGGNTYYSTQQNLPTVFTYTPTNVTQTSATFNGNITANNVVSMCANCGINTNYYFQYGTSQYSLTQQTPSQIFSNVSGNTSAYVSNLSPNTTYFVQLVATNGYGTNYGSILQFTTPAVIQTYIQPQTQQPIIITRIISSDSSTNNSGISNTTPSLSISSNPSSVIAGNTITYIVTYQNMGNSSVSNAMINTTLPTGVVFQQASQGVITTNNTVLSTLGSLAANQQGSITVTGTVTNTNSSASGLVTNATLTYTDSNNAQHSVVAYAVNNSLNGNQNTNNNVNTNLTGFAAGAGFFPSSLIGWVIIIGIIILIYFISREFYSRGTAIKNGNNSGQH